MAVGVVIGILFLEETHAEKKYHRDRGVEAGQWLLSWFHRCAKSKSYRNEKSGELDETHSLIEEHEQLPGYCTTENSPLVSSATTLGEPQDQLSLDDEFIPTKQKPAASKAFTKQVVLNIIGYGILA